MSATDVKARRFKIPRTVTEDVYTLAKQRLVNIFNQFDEVLVSFSGGKDSTATLMVALEVLAEHPEFAHHLPLRTVFYDEEAISQETADYVARVGSRPDVALEWYCLPVQHRNACSRKSPYWWPWAAESRDLWCRPLPEGALTSLPGFMSEPPSARRSIPQCAELLAANSRGNLCMLMGIRAQESMTRRRAVTYNGNGENYLIRFETAGTRVWKGYPVYDWTTEDVWTAPAKMGWDYNESYDRMEMLGIPHAQQRCSPAYGEEPMQGLHKFAACFPEVWDKMVYRVPGVGAAVRYARTELYASHGRPDKPEGMTWPDFLLHYLGKFEPKERASIAKRIQDHIRVHYSHANDPILEHAPHPYTGMSWDWLLAIAMRGDFKNRKIALTRTGNDEHGNPHPKHWVKYIAELRDIIAADRFEELAYPRPQPDPERLMPAYAREALKDVTA